MTQPHLPADSSLVDSRYAAWRLVTALAIATLGNSGMYVLSVVLPEIEREFGVSRADASLPYTLTMVGFGLGGIFCGKWADKFGIMRVLMIGALATAAGYLLASLSPNLCLFALAHSVLIGCLGIASAFVPLMADTALWWNKHRGIAVAVCASGNYMAGSIWPPLVQMGIEQYGWRPTYLVLGVVCGVGMALLSLRMRQRPPLTVAAAGSNTLALQASQDRPFRMRKGWAQTCLFVAGVGCCVAMSMPQVHIVAYCTDLGFGAARGAEMLSLMLVAGIMSRLASGWISDRIGGLRTLMLGSALQCVALFLFLPFEGLTSLYVISALFGLFQGGIVPSYALIVRAHFPPQEAGARLGVIIFGTLIGMALGGWLSGKVFDVTGSYQAAFVNGIAWNLLNLTIVVVLYLRTRPFKPGPHLFVKTS